MNEILLAVLGLLGVFVVGVVCYGVLFKGYIGDENAVKLTIGRFLVAGLGMFVVAYAFIYLFKHVTLGDATGIGKGVELALLVGIPFMVVPIFADAPYFKSNKMGIEWAVIVNWLLSFVVLGMIVGALA